VARILTTEIRTEEIIGWKKIKAKKAYLGYRCLAQVGELLQLQFVENRAWEPVEDFTGEVAHAWAYCGGARRV